MLFFNVSLHVKKYARQQSETIEPQIKDQGKLFHMKTGGVFFEKITTYS